MLYRKFSPDTYYASGAWSVMSVGILDNDGGVYYNSYGRRSPLTDARYYEQNADDYAWYILRTGSMDRATYVYYYSYGRIIAAHELRLLRVACYPFWRCLLRRPLCQLFLRAHLLSLDSFMYYNYTSFYIIEDGSMITYAVEYSYGYYPSLWKYLYRQTCKIFCIPNI